MNKQQGFKRDRNGNNDRRDDSQDKKIKRDNDRRDNGDDDKKLNTFKSMNTMFNKLIHKIMQEIKNEEFFRWPRPMFGDPKTRNSTLKCSYHKDHGHMTETCRTLKQFLEGLVEKGRLSKYVKRDETKSNEQAKAADEKGTSAQAVKPVVGVIEAIHGVINRS
ncbi:hypothetical protein LguiB_017996 [Lonicera macranthoides]